MATRLNHARAGAHALAFDRIPIGVLVCLVALAVGACGPAMGPAAPREEPSVTETTTANAASTTTTWPPTGAMSDALQAWANFPVNTNPRPLVVIDDPVKAPDYGFATGDAKEAFAQGSFTAPPDLPSGPPEVDGYPVIDALTALADMRREGSQGGGSVPVVAPLAITRVELGSAQFRTDRGTRSFPAWMFSFDGVTHPAKVLAVAPQSLFPEPPESLHTSGPGAQLASDGRTLYVTFAGAAEGTGPCTADYTVDQAASPTAVAINIRETRTGNDPGVACAAVGYVRHASIVLDAPLGNRVLVSGATKGAIAHRPLNLVGHSDVPPRSLPPVERGVTADALQRACAWPTACARAQEVEAAPVA